MQAISLANEVIKNILQIYNGGSQWNVDVLRCRKIYRDRISSLTFPDLGTGIADGGRLAESI